MMVTNTVGAALFMRILLDKRAMFEKYTSAFSATALKVAASTEGILRQGFNEVNSMKVAQVLYQELDIGAVAITDREKTAGFYRYWRRSPSTGQTHFIRLYAESD